MTINDLKNYRFICADINRRKKKLDEQKQHVVDAVQTAAEFPYWEHTIPIEGDIYPPGASIEFAELHQLEHKKTEIERFVLQIDDYRIRRAVEVRYIEPSDNAVTWEFVAGEIGYNGSGNALKQAVWQYLQKNNKNNTSNKSI